MPPFTVHAAWLLWPPVTGTAARVIGRLDRCLDKALEPWRLSHRPRGAILGSDRGGDRSPGRGDRGHQQVQGALVGSGDRCQPGRLAEQLESPRRRTDPPGPGRARRRRAGPGRHCAAPARRTWLGRAGRARPRPDALAADRLAPEAGIEVQGALAGVDQEQAETVPRPVEAGHRIEGPWGEKRSDQPRRDGRDEDRHGGRLGHQFRADRTQVEDHLPVETQVEEHCEERRPNAEGGHRGSIGCRLRSSMTTKPARRAPAPIRPATMGVEDRPRVLPCNSAKTRRNRPPVSTA